MFKDRPLNVKVGVIIFQMPDIFAEGGLLTFMLKLEGGFVVAPSRFECSIT